MTETVNSQQVETYVNNIAPARARAAAQQLRSELARGRMLRVPGGVANAATMQAIIDRLDPASVRRAPVAQISNETPRLVVGYDGMTYNGRPAVKATTTYVVVKGTMNGLPAFYVVRQGEEGPAGQPFRRSYLAADEALTDITRVSGETEIDHFAHLATNEPR